MYKIELFQISTFIIINCLLRSTRSAVFYVITLFTKRLIELPVTVVVLSACGYLGFVSFQVLAPTLLPKETRVSVLMVASSATRTKQNDNNKSEHQWSNNSNASFLPQVNKRMLASDER